ncbi:MAG: molybdopterin cofactor-binding domain-containing protein [Ilumatobacteraceae bacterium]
MRHVQIRHGRDVNDVRADADVTIETEYELGRQDPAFLGPESGIAIPAEDGGVDLHVAAQWLHTDQQQVAARSRAAARQGAPRAGRRRRGVRWT